MSPIWLRQRAIKNLNFRFKRLGSSHGHVDPKNSNRFAGLSTFNHDYIQHGFSKPNQIRPNENNIEFGKDEADHNTSHSKLGSGRGSNPTWVQKSA